MKPDFTQYTFRLPTATCWSHLWRKPSFEYLSSNHCDGSIFFNAEQARQNQHQAEAVTRHVKSKLAPWQVDYQAEFEKMTTSANRMLPRERPDASFDDWKVWFIGHATVLLQIGPYNFLTDPNWSDFAGPYKSKGIKRVCPVGLALEELPPIDAVLLSHNHYEHMDLATLNWLHQHFEMPIFTGLGNAYYLPKSFNVTELDWWQWEAFGELKIVYLPAQHNSGRGLRDQNRALWGGFAIKHAADYCFFAGDTGYASHFKSIYQRLGAPRVALLPIGMNGQQALHLSPEEAFQAHQDLHSKCSIAISYRSFQMSNAKREYPEQQMQRIVRHTSKLINPFYCLQEGKKMIV